MLKKIEKKVEFFIIHILSRLKLSLQLSFRTLILAEDHVLSKTFTLILPIDQSKTILNLLP